MKGLAFFGVALALCSCSRSTSSSGSSWCFSSTSTAVVPAPGADTTRYNGTTGLDIDESSEGLGGRSSGHAHLVANASGAFDYTLECKVWENEESRSGTVPAAVVTDFVHAVAARGPGGLTDCPGIPPGMTDQGKGSFELDVHTPRGMYVLTVGACSQWSENSVALAADDGKAGSWGDVHPSINAKYQAIRTALAMQDCYRAAGNPPKPQRPHSDPGDGGNPFDQH